MGGKGFNEGIFFLIYTDGISMISGCFDNNISKQVAMFYLSNPR